MLVQRGYGKEKGEWSLPGGHVDHRERSHRAAVRELREETGLIAEVVSTIMEGRRHPIKTFFGRITGGSLKAKRPECLDARFFSYRNLPPLAFDADSRAIRKWQEMKENHRKLSREKVPDLCPHCDSGNIALRRYPHQLAYRCRTCKKTLASSTYPGLLPNGAGEIDGWELLGGWNYTGSNLTEVPRWVSDKLSDLIYRWKRSGYSDYYVLVGKHYRYTVTFAAQGAALCDIYRKPRQMQVQNNDTV